MKRVIHVLCACLLGYGLPGVACASGGAAPGGPAGAGAPPLSVSRTPDRRPVLLSAVPREGAGDRVLARVAGAEVRRSDVGDFVLRYYREEADAALTHLVDERIIAAEAETLSVSVPPARVEAAVEEELARRETRIRVDYGADVGLERYLGEKYGLGLAEHRRDLERLVRTRLLRDRVIRYRQRLLPRVEIRDAVFTDLGEAERAAGAARGGADLGLLAADRGVRPEVALPPFAREEITPPELAERVFALAPGEVSEPVAVTEGGRTLFHVIKLVRHLPATDASWEDLRGEIEAGLQEREVGAHEYGSWARRARALYGVEVLR